MRDLNRTAKTNVIAGMRLVIAEAKVADVIRTHDRYRFCDIVPLPRICSLISIDVKEVAGKRERAIEFGKYPKSPLKNDSINTFHVIFGRVFLQLQHS